MARICFGRGMRALGKASRKRFGTRRGANMVRKVPGSVTQAWILHQRGADGAGPEPEAELHGNAYFFNGATTQHDQSLIAQCCRATPTRPAFFDIKSCPDRCGLVTWSTD